MANIKSHLPIYSRPPCKLIRYEIRDFNDGAGNGGQRRIAIYFDKHSNQKEMIAQTIWQYGWFCGISKEEFKATCS